MFEDSKTKGQELTTAGMAAAESAKTDLQQPLTPVKDGSSEYSRMRRSQRVHLRTPVVVYGQDPDGKVFAEDTHTVIVNANGALVLLVAEVKLKEKLLILSQQTKLERECYVAWLGDRNEGKHEVGVGFVEPAPQFWGVNFPPDNWDRATRKLPTGKNP